MNLGVDVSLRLVSERLKHDNAGNLLSLIEIVSFSFHIKMIGIDGQ